MSRPDGSSQLSFIKHSRLPLILKNKRVFERPSVSYTAPSPEIGRCAGSSVLPYLEEMFIRSQEANAEERYLELPGLHQALRERQESYLATKVLQKQWSVLRWIQVMERWGQIVSEKESQEKWWLSEKIKLPYVCVVKMPPRTWALQGGVSQCVALSVGDVLGWVKSLPCQSPWLHDHGFLASSSASPSWPQFPHL